MENIAHPCKAAQLSIHLLAGRMTAPCRPMPPHAAPRRPMPPHAAPPPPPRCASSKQQLQPFLPARLPPLSLHCNAAAAALRQQQTLHLCKIRLKRRHLGLQRSQAATLGAPGRRDSAPAAAGTAARAGLAAAAAAAALVATLIFVCGRLWSGEVETELAFAQRRTEGVGLFCVAPAEHGSQLLLQAAQGMPCISCSLSSH